MKMNNAEFERSLDRFRTFLKTEPVLPLLSRNLFFLRDENRVVDSVETDDGLRCRTEGKKVIVSAAPYLMRDEYDRRHWIAAMRVFLAHEVQHDNSSDREVLRALRARCGKRFHDEYGLDYELGAALGQRLLNALEDARVGNIVCQRFPGYVPMLRFTNYARLAAPPAVSAPAREGLGELRDFLNDFEHWALAGLRLPGVELYAGSRFEAAAAQARPLADRAVLAETAADCAALCAEIFSRCADYLAALCRPIDDKAALLKELTAALEDYRFSDADRAEQRGDGTDGGAREKKPPKKPAAGEHGASEDADESELEKGDSGSPGSGDNTKREGDESGSLSGEEAKPKATAGSNGREDRGESSSDGRSTNHGATGRGDGMTNAQRAASEEAAEEGAQSISEVLGAQFSTRRGPALTDNEIDAMLETAAAELAREAAHQKSSRIEAGEQTPLRYKDVSTLQSLYKNVTFTETFITPKNKPLPPEYLSEAKRLHAKLDRILKEQRVREASQRKGSLNPESLWKLAVCDPDVFARKTPPKKCESDFYLLIDRSGSMGTGYGNGNSRLFTALMTAAVIEEALKGLAYTKIVGFDGGTDVVEHCVIKDFNQKATGNRCFDALDQITAGNGNKDGYSIRVATMDLQKRSEKRKVLIVLSDGLPSAYGQESGAIADVRSAVQEARRRGIIVIPIMFGVTDTAESYEAYRQMYEKGIISTSSRNILPELEKLLYALIR